MQTKKTNHIRKLTNFGGKDQACRICLSDEVNHEREMTLINVCNCKGNYNAVIMSITHYKYFISEWITYGLSYFLYYIILMVRNLRIYAFSLFETVDG